MKSVTFAGTKWNITETDGEGNIKLSSTNTNYNHKAAWNSSDASFVYVWCDDDLERNLFEISLPDDMAGSLSTLSSKAAAKLARSR
jgi:hypothetical protein